MTYSMLITGTSGFVGTHLCRHPAITAAADKVALLDIVPASPRHPNETLIDISERSAVSELAQNGSAPVMIHLAAKAEVVMPFAMMADLERTNVLGTIHLLESFMPRRFVLASSSAVYGSVHGRLCRPTRGESSPVGAYGVTKLMGEVLASAWAEEHGASAVSLRFGNIVGPGCRGLIPYLVSHALRYPGASVEAQLRGQGEIVRDYVPVRYATEAIVRSAELPMHEGASAIFNVASGRPMTNGTVARIAAEVLERNGHKIRLNFDNPIPVGESESVVLDIAATTERLGISPPTEDEIVDAIERATLSHLQAAVAP